MAGIDWNCTAEDYGRYRAGFPASFFERLGALGAGLPGQAVLDMGTGTGTLARGLAHRGCTVTGIDIAPAMLEQARALDAEAGVWVRYTVARAEATGEPDATYDMVTAGQCWHWFDRQQAAAEARRVLRPGGTLVIAHYDWLPLPGSVVEATEQLILAFNPAWQGAGGTGIYPNWPAEPAAAGFTGIETRTYDEPALYDHAAWRGRIRASAGVAASLSPPEVARFDAALAALLAERFPEQPLLTPHRVFILTCRA